jgi:DNA polymerase-3 subunit delta'
MIIHNNIRYNWSIVGHQKIVDFLLKSISVEKYAHAYLFTGPEGIGKKTVAKLFVQSILCKKSGKKIENSIPCGKCSSCELFIKNIYPDVFVVEKAVDKKNISIEQIRDLQHFLNLKSFMSSEKIALILQAESLSEEASNSLLKTLEEPYGNTIIILVSSKIDFLLPTIISRCQVIRFGLTPEKIIYKFLIKRGLNKVTAKNLAALSQGHIGKAIKLSKLSDQLEYYDDKVEQFVGIMRGNLIDGFRIINILIPPRAKLQDFLEELKDILIIWKSVIRDLVLLKINLNHLIVNKIKLEKLRNLSNQFTLLKLSDYLTEISNVQFLLELNVNPKLVLENLFLKIKQNI